MSQVTLLDPQGDETLIHQQNNRTLEGNINALNNYVSFPGGLNSDNFRQNPWTNYVPALTATTSSPTLGTGSNQQGAWVRQADKLVNVNIRIDFGTAGAAAGTGTYQVSVPVVPSYGDERLIGHGFLFDSSGTDYELCAARYDGSTFVNLITNAGLVTNAAPWTWAASDLIFLALAYEAVD